jgi:hypothetical protein
MWRTLFEGPGDVSLGHVPVPIRANRQDAWCVVARAEK